MLTTAIVNAKIVLEHKIIDNAILLYKNGKIIDYGTADEVDIPKNSVIYDAKGLYVGPGFIDIHCHGGGPAKFEDDPVRTAEFFLKNGTTTILPTFYNDISPDDMIDVFDKTITAMTNGTAKNIGGIYMEGPYYNVKFGADSESNKWGTDINPDDYEKVVQKGGKYIKAWTIAPEREGIEPFLKKAKEINPDVVFSIGHSEATPAQVEALKKYGIKNLTHCTNATGRQPCEDGTRNCGPDEACFLDDDMYAEVICDSKGIHVNEYMLRLILKIKSIDKVILISDSTVNPLPSPPHLAHIQDLTFDQNGTIYGSKLTLCVACRNMINHTGVSICDAFNMASRNPARLIGMDKEIGTIDIGKKANLIVIDSDFNIKNVILEGEFVC